MTAHHTLPPAAWRDRIAMGLMILLGLFSLAVCAEAALTFAAVPLEAVAVEAWRMFGYAVFAGLFFLVAVRPRRMTGIWELILFHKLGTALFLVPYVGADAGTGAGPTESIGYIAANDVFLVAVTATAYVLARGWRAWRR